MPHVSGLGPLLYLIYINDLPLALQDSNVSMYADDASPYYQSNDVTHLNEVTNNASKRLNSWLQDKQLSLNVAKTHSMLLATKQKHRALGNQHEILGLKFRENELQVVQNTKCLGIQIDSYQGKF